MKKQTAELSEWSGTFGESYTDRNLLTPGGHDALYLEQLGVSRTELNEEFLNDIPRNARILEVGCNIGNQLIFLEQMGFSNLFGLEPQPYALDLAKSRAPNVMFGQGTAFSIPYENEYFDLVFTSRVLIHISPNDLPAAMDEIYRCAGSYIWGLEYFSPEFASVRYRDREGLLWKGDFAKAYLNRFPDLQLVKERRLPYINDGNVDSTFLLRRKN
jgi:pseudaminic acid biosynthesis-associated methylase